MGGKMRTSIHTLKSLQKESDYKDRAKIEMIRQSLLATPVQDGELTVINTPAPAKVSYISSNGAGKYDGLV
jgi:hypothetical protein